MRSLLVTVVMLGISVLLLITAVHVANAEDMVHFSDDFDGPNGPLDTRKWTVSKLEETSNVTVLNGSARMHVHGWDRVVAVPDVEMDIYPFEVEFMWLQEVGEGHTLELQVANSEDGVRWNTEEWIYYDAGPGEWYRDDPTTTSSYRYRISDVPAQVGNWYRVRLTVDWSSITFRVYGSEGDEPMVDHGFYHVMDQYATFKIGAWADDHAVTAARIDDLQVYRHDTTTKDPIEVDPIPALVMVEDEERMVDLAPYVHDPDGDEGDIHVETTDHHAVYKHGLNVTFLCNEEGGTREVRLTFTDGYRFTDVFVELVIEGVNDPPQLTLIAPEDGRTLYDVENIRVEFSVVDPDSDGWTAYVSVQAQVSDYDWNVEETVGSSRHGVVTAPSVGPGSYVVSVMLNDGESQDSAEAVVYVEVTEETVPPSTPDSFDTNAFAVCMSAILLAAVAIGIVVAVANPIKKRYMSQAELDAKRARRLARKARDPPSRSRQWTQAPPPVQSQRRPPAPVRSPVPAPRPPPAIPPSSGVSRAVARPEGNWRVSSVEEFLALIPRLPEGFPEPLWGIPQEEVGRQVVESTTLGPDGRSVCKVNGRPYHADKRDLSTFLKPL
jgi:hypothetical protein